MNNFRDFPRELTGLLFHADTRLCVRACVRECVCAHAGGRVCADMHECLYLLVTSRNLKSKRYEDMWGCGLEQGQIERLRKPWDYALFSPAVCIHPGMKHAPPRCFFEDQPDWNACYVYRWTHHVWKLQKHPNREHHSSGILTDYPIRVEELFTVRW